MRETFADRLGRLRRAKEFSPTDIAQMIRVTEGTVRHWESGHTKVPSLTVGIRLAKALAVSPEYLAFGDGPGAEGEDEKVVTLPGAFDDRLQGAEERLAAVEANLLTVTRTAREALALAAELRDAAQPARTRRGAS